MPSANGNTPERVVLYARVSTQEQATKGYSLSQQLEALRAYAAREGYKILEEVTDPGESGAYLERPGVDRIMELVAAGGVSVVLAQDGDRISREPWHHEYLKLLMSDQGTELRTLDDGADDSPMGEFVRYIRRGVAKLERTEIAKRSMRGRRRKAAEGKIVGSHAPRCGFRYVNTERDAYEVDEERMFVVRRIFRMVGAEGATLYAVRKALEAAGIRSPGGKKLWHQGYLRNMILDDAYKPHTFTEVAALVSPEVAAKLDQERSYGVAYYDCRGQSRKKVPNDGRDGKAYRYTYKNREKPREDWIAIPVPDADIPREWVEAAREAIRENHRPSSAGRRFWELSGGILRCASCERAMQTTSIRSKAGKTHNYYRCPKRVRDGKMGCENAKNLRADETELQVWEEVSALLRDPERLRVGLKSMIEGRKKETRMNPERDAATWLKQLDELARRRSAFQDQQAAGCMTLSELAARLSELEDARQGAERELERLRGVREEMEALQRDANALLVSFERSAPEQLNTLGPEERHHVYRMMRLKVLAHPDGSLEATGDIPLDISMFSTTNARAETLSGPRRS